MTALAVFLSGCSLWHGVFDAPRTAVIDPLPMVPGCAAQDQPQLHYFGGVAALDQWLAGRSLPASGVDPRMEGPFVLIEPARPGAYGDSLLVSREAILHSGGRLFLSGTFYQAATAPPAGTSPCELLALPPQQYGAIELYDQEGALRARTTTREENQP